MVLLILWFARFLRKNGKAKIKYLEFLSEMYVCTYIEVVDVSYIFIFLEMLEMFTT